MSFYNDSSTNTLFRENMMGTTLHNKIYLGRTPLLGSRRIQAAVCAGAVVGIALAWMAIRLIK